MSPDIFNIYSEMILTNLENYPGVKINGENINNIRYADDTVLIADSEENLQRLLDITIEKSDEMGLTLNVKKTECMVISKKAIAPSCNLQSREQQMKLVKKFKYLGYMITSDGKCKSCLMTEMFGEAWPPMSVPDLAPDDDDDLTHVQIWSHSV